MTAPSKSRTGPPADQGGKSCRAHDPDIAGQIERSRRRPRGGDDRGAGHRRHLGHDRLAALATLRGDEHLQHRIAAPQQRRCGMPEAAVEKHNRRGRVAVRIADVRNQADPPRARPLAVLPAPHGDSGRRPGRVERRLRDRAATGDEFLHRGLQRRLRGIEGGALPGQPRRNRQVRAPGHQRHRRQKRQHGKHAERGHQGAPPFIPVRHGPSPAFRNAVAPRPAPASPRHWTTRTRRAPPGPRSSSRRRRVQSTAPHCGNARGEHLGAAACPTRRRRCERRLDLVLQISAVPPEGDQPPVRRGKPGRVALVARHHVGQRVRGDLTQRRAGIVITGLLEITGQPGQRPCQRPHRLPAILLTLPEPLLEVRKRHRHRHDHPGQRQREQKLDEGEPLLAGETTAHRCLRRERRTTWRGSKPPRALSQKQCTVQRGGSAEGDSRS